MRFLTFLLFAIAVSTSVTVTAQQRYRLVFWNVENLFDTYRDSVANDADFTPSGKNHWTSRRYAAKITNLGKALVAMGEAGEGRLDMPFAIGMAEVENDKVLRDLCHGTPLKRFGYDFVHHDSHDRRGIDNALLYRRDLFRPFLSQSVNVSDSAFVTRDILLVEGILDKTDTVILLVNHFPSKLNVENERRRETIAYRLRYIMDTAAAAHPAAAVIAMGDFNASPDEPEIKKILMRDNDGQFINLMANSNGRGSYNYQGQWSFIDQIIVSHNLADTGSTCPLRLTTMDAQAFEADFLLTDDERNLSQKANRTYLGIRYVGGYSDHLPVYTDLRRKE